MRAIGVAIDTNRTPLVYAGTVRPVMRFGEKDVQETNGPGGAPLWDVDVLLEVPQYGGESKVETVACRVPAKDRPQLQRFQPVPFEHPVMSAYVRSNELRVNLSAAGIAGESAGGKVRAA